MRTTIDIIGAVQEQQPVTEHELKLALLCLYYDGALATTADFENASHLKLKLRAKESWERRFRMLKAEPDRYLGDRYTPGTEANATGRAASEAIYSAAMTAAEAKSKP